MSGPSGCFCGFVEYLAVRASEGHEHDTAALCGADDKVQPLQDGPDAAAAVTVQYFYAANERFVAYTDLSPRSGCTGVSSVSVSITGFFVGDKVCDVAGSSVGKFIVTGIDAGVERIHHGRYFSARRRAKWLAVQRERHLVDSVKTPRQGGGVENALQQVGRDG